MKLEHLAIMDKDTINKILSGKKTIESRFSKNKITPYNKVNVGEIIYLKESGGNILATFEIDKVIFFDNLDCQKILAIKNKYNQFINASNDYFNYKSNCRYGTLIYIKSPKAIPPITIYKNNRLAFLTVKSIVNDLILIHR